MNPNAQVFQKYYAKLIDAIVIPGIFATKFFEKGLISPETRDAATEVDNTRTNYQRAAALMEVVEKRVHQNPDRLGDVLLVLYSQSSTKELAIAMDKEGINVDPK